MRNSLLAAAALAAALSAGCRRREPPAPAAGLPSGSVTLTAPAPAGVGLGPATTDYTNEMQAENLRAQAAEMGISRLTKPSEQDPNEDDRPPITYEEGMARTKEYERAFAAQRRALERNKKKTVRIPGTTPGLLPKQSGGTPVESGDDAPAASTGSPKGPETK